MSSNPIEPKIVFKTYTSSFKLLDDGQKDVVKKLKDASKALVDFKDWVDGVMPYIRPFINLIKSNPLTFIIKSIKKYLQDVIQTFLSMGFYMIIVHPWNQAGKRTKKFKFDILNPANEWGQMVDGFQAQNHNAKVYKEIDLLEEERYEKRSNPVSVEYLNKLIIQQKKLLVPENYVQNHWIKPIDASIPILSYTDAIDEIIVSLDNSDDVYRPKWNTANRVVGWGLIVGMNDPLELIEKLKVINKLFEFSSLSKSLFKFDRTMRSISADATSKLRTSRVQKTKWTEEGKDLFADIKNEADGKEKLRLLAIFLYENTLENPISNKVFGSYPEWFALSIERIPYIRQIRDKFFEYFDELIIVAESTDSMINTIVDAILDKINWLMQLVADFNELITLLLNLELALSGVTFTINEDLKYKDGGGVPILKSSLQKIKSLDTSLFDPSMSEQDISKEIANLKLAEYSTVIFIAGGWTNGELLKTQWEALLKLLGHELSKDIKGLIEKDKPKSLGDIDLTDPDRIPIVEVNKELQGEAPILTEKNFTLEIVSDPFVTTLSYTINSDTNSDFKIISHEYKDMTTNGLITKSLVFPDKSLFTLIINYTSSSKEYMKIITFSTDFSLLHLIAPTDNSNETNGDYTSTGVSDSSLIVEAEISVMEIPYSVNTSDYSNAALLTNTTGNTLFYTVYGPNGEILFDNIPLLMGLSTSIEFIGLDGEYTVIIYSNGKVELISKSMVKVSSYGIITSNILDNINVFITSDSMYLLFPDSLGRFIFINGKIYELPAFIPLSVGNYSYFLIDKTGKWSEERLLKLVQSSNLSRNNCLEVRTT